MTTKRPAGLFVTGTDTEVGKTVVAASIARQLHSQGVRVGVYKPVASGCRQEPSGVVAEDAEVLWEAAGRPLSLEAVCPQRFVAPVAPHVAAHQENTHVDGELLRTGCEAWTGECDILIVEGAGGLMSPMSDDDYVADVALDLGYPLIVVAPNSLGVINQVLQTLITASTFREGIPVAGVVLNDVKPPAELDESSATNRRELEQRCVPPVLGHLGWQSEKVEPLVDWKDLATPPVTA